MKSEAAACFAFSANEDMKVYVVSKVVGSKAFLAEVQGKVAGGTPVIIACPGATPSDNRINLESKDGVKPTNMLSGEYFNSSDFCGPKAYHYNALPWDATTMRVLGTTKDGRLGFVKNTELKTIPRNKAYLVVSANAPDEIILEMQGEQLRGDLNGDDLVNGTDLVAMVNMIMEQIPQTSAADLNGDEQVNGTDLVILVGLILNAQ